VTPAEKIVARLGRLAYRWPPIKTAEVADGVLMKAKSRLGRVCWSINSLLDDAAC
jgi:hypothetical protein